LLPPRRIFPVVGPTIEPHAHQHVFKPRVIRVVGDGPDER
jgi:hypothetical protein